MKNIPYPLESDMNYAGTFGNTSPMNVMLCMFYYSDLLATLRENGVDYAVAHDRIWNRERDGKELIERSKRLTTPVSLLYR